MVGVSPSKVLPFQFNVPKALTLIAVNVEFLIKVLRCIIGGFGCFGINDRRSLAQNGDRLAVGCDIDSSAAK